MVIETVELVTELDLAVCAQMAQYARFVKRKRMRSVFQLVMNGQNHNLMFYSHHVALQRIIH